MLPSGDIRVAVHSFLIAYGQVDDLEVQLVGTEQQIEIPKGIEIPKILPIGLQLQIVFSDITLVPQRVSLTGCSISQLKSKLKNLLPRILKGRMLFFSSG